MLYVILSKPYYVICYFIKVMVVVDNINIWERKQIRRIYPWLAHNWIHAAATWRVNGFKFSENIPYGATIYKPNASLFSSCNQNLSLLQANNWPSFSVAVIVVVDCSHIWERHQLPVDVLKVLHLHRDKASCLVLNKVS